MTEIVHTLGQELLAIESDVEKFEAEAAKIQLRLRLTSEKAEKIRALIALYDEEAAAGVKPPLSTVPPVPSPPVDTLRHAEEVSEPAASPQEAGGGLYPPILRRFGRASSPGTER